MFVNDGFTDKMRNGIINIRTRGASHKKWRVGFERNMLDVDVMPAVLAEALKQHVGFLRGWERFNERIFSAGEVVFLDVDEEEGCFHSGIGNR